MPSAQVTRTEQRAVDMTRAAAEAQFFQNQNVILRVLNLARGRKDVHANRQIVGWPPCADRPGAG